MQIVNPQRIKKADLVVGIPSYNEADTIGFVVQQAGLGLKRYFPRQKSVIINVDNNSPDETKKTFLGVKTWVPKIYISTPKGVKGKGNNFHNLFNEMIDLGARAGVVVDADLKSITPEWIKNLAVPIAEGYDFAVPIYARNKYDGTITNNICYPLVYALLGKDMRQPIGGDFSFSDKIVRYWLAQRWAGATKQYGIDIFMTLGAVFGKFKICQTGLGTKIHKPSAIKLGPMFSQVVGTLFKGLVTHREQWSKGEKVEHLPILGKKKIGKPQGLGVDYETIKDVALYEFKTNRLILKRLLAGEVYNKIIQLYKNKIMGMDKDLWMRCIYDLLYAYDTTDAGPSLIKAIKPLFFWRVCSFYKETMDLNYQESEKEIKKQACHFLKNRDYLFNKYGSQEKGQ